MSPEYDNFLRAYGLFFVVKQVCSLIKIFYSMLYERVDGPGNEDEKKT